MSLFKRGNVWWYEFKHLGTRYRESTHTDDKQTAGRAERQRRKRVEESGNDLEPVARPVKVAKAVRDFLEEKDTWAQRTRGIHENSWKHLAPYFGELLLQDISPAAITGIGPRGRRRVPGRDQSTSKFR